MANHSTDTAKTLFGEGFARDLPPLESGLLKAIRVRIRKGLKEYEQIGEPQPLDVAAGFPPEGEEWWCPVEFDGARWKVLIIPPPWLSKAEWSLYEETIISKGLNRKEPYGKSFLRFMRQTAKSVVGDLSVSEPDRREVIEQLDMIFARMDDSDDEKLWNLLEMAFMAGKDFSKLFSNEEGKKIALKGFKQVLRQGMGRPEGAQNKSSKKKAAEQAKLAHQKQVKEIVELWLSHESHNSCDFMDILVSKSLAMAGDWIEGGENNRGKYQLAGKGKFLTHHDCARKIREWVKKSQ